MEKYFKNQVTALHGYTSPPQTGMIAKLNQNESPFDVPETIKTELLKKIGSLEWNLYPVNESPQLCEKLASRFNVAANQILLGNGSNQLLQTILTAALESGDRVLYCPPSFSLFDLFPVIYGGTLVKEFQAPGAAFPLDAVLQRIEQENPKIVLLCSPNNPTGSVISLDDLKTVCEKSSGLVFFDEAYAEFHTESAVDLVREYPNLIISRTFSKAFSLAGLRFGYFISTASNIEQLRKVNLPYNVNLMTEQIALRLLDEQDLIQKNVKYISDERDRVYKEMSGLSGITVYPSAANFILFKTNDGKKTFQQLKDKKVLVRDVSGYDLCENHLRVSIGLREHNNLFLEILKVL